MGLATVDVVPKARILKAKRILTKAARRAKGSCELREALGPPPQGHEGARSASDFRRSFATDLRRQVSTSTPNPMAAG